jgi:hypothetical protein
MLMAACLFLGPSAMLGQSPGTNVFEGKAEGFKITLPDDWVEIPQGVLQDYFDRIAKMAPGVPQQYFQHGYQRRGHGSEIIYPYTLVQAQGKGPVREEEVAKLARQPDFAEKSLKSAQSQLTNIISDVGKSSTTYDYTRHVLQMKSRMEVPGVGTIEMISAAFLTSKGTLNFNCYSLESDTNSPQNIFDPAIASVQLAEEFVYHPPGFHRSRLTDVLFCGLVGGCIGVLIYLVKRLLFGETRKIRVGQS